MGSVIGIFWQVVRCKANVTFHALPYCGLHVEVYARPRYDAITRYHVDKLSKSFSSKANNCSWRDNLTESACLISFELPYTLSGVPCGIPGPQLEYQERHRYAENILTSSF